MKESTGPATRTYAIVVGIEKYALGSGPGIDLDGPAHDASQFADWLVSRGVPRENIALLLSPLESNNSSLGEWSVSSQWPATRKGVSDVVTQWLPKQTGDLLWVFWGGHGVMTATRSRRLFYADTTTADWYHLDLESLLTRLSSDNLPSFQQQIYLIDTCANYRRQLPQERLGSGDRFPPGEPVRGREQFVFFATQEGEVAKNLSQEQTGFFSKMVLEELAKEPSRSWPPDMEKLARRVRESFSDPAKAGKTKQRPIFASYRTWDGTQYVFGQQAEQAPAIWNVPYQRNPFFVGREAVFQSLRRDLVPGGRTTALTQVISGLGGIGKTQVAIEYAHRYASSYEAVLWLQADSWETLTAACLQLATEVLGLPEQQEANKQIEEVKRWLQKHRGWLLILDNVEKPHEILPAFLPSKHQGSVLITARMRNVEPLAQSEILPVLSRYEGVLFLLRRAKKIKQQASMRKATHKDVLMAKDLYRLMDGLPLALDQAGAYIAENGCSLQRYIDLYQQFRPKLLDRREATDHPASVQKTFCLSWEQIRERNALAGKALQFCAFLAPDQIPEQLVLEGITRLEAESTTDALEMDEALGLLHRYSLVERTEQMLSLHRLVQEVTQDVLSEEERQQWMERAVLVVNMVFPSGEHGTWPLGEFLLPHALTCAKWIKDLGQKKFEGVRLLTVTGRYLHERAQYREAEPLYQRALLIAEEQLGASHPNMATSLNNLALLYASQGRYDEAEPLYQRALTIYEQQLGASHSRTATSLNNLAGLYDSQGRYDEAEPLYQRALTIYEQQLGASHPDTATSLNNLAELYQARGRYDEAEPLYQRALTIYEQQLGASHPNMATSLNNLALLYASQGRYDEAEPLYQRALLIAEEQLGASHPSTAVSLNNLAELYRAQGRYDEAEPLYQRALTIYEQQLGASHPNMATSLNNLALLYASQGRYDEAEPLYQRALLIAEEQLGASHPSTAASLNSLAGLYWARGRYDEAEPLYQRALTIYEQQLGASHPNMATSLNNLALLYASQGRYDEAEPLCQRALTIYEQQLGASHPSTAVSLNNLAELYQARGRYDEAEPLYQRALLITEEQLGASHPSTAVSLNNLAGLYRARGRYDEAEPLYQRALTIYEQQLGASHPDTATSLNNLAELYQARGRYDEAEPLYQRALLITEEQLGASHPSTAVSLNNLAGLYRAQGRYDEAEPLYQRALTIYEQQLGASHPDTATSLNNLAELYRAQGRYDEAEPLCQRALTIYEQQLEASHPNMATSLNNLAELYRAQGRYDEAEPLYQRAMKLSLASLGMEHSQTQQILMNYLTLLSHIHPGADSETLLHLFTQGVLDDNVNGEATQE